MVLSVLSITVIARLEAAIRSPEVVIVAVLYERNNLGSGISRSSAGKVGFAIRCRVARLTASMIGLAFGVRHERRTK